MKVQSCVVNRSMDFIRYCHFCPQSSPWCVECVWFGSETGKVTVIYVVVWNLHGSMFTNQETHAKSATSLSFSTVHHWDFNTYCTLFNVFSGYGRHWVCTVEANYAIRVQNFDWMFSLSLCLNACQ